MESFSRRVFGPALQLSSSGFQACDVKNLKSVGGLVAGIDAAALAALLKRKLGANSTVGEWVAKSGAVTLGAAAAPPDAGLRLDYVSVLPLSVL